MKGNHEWAALGVNTYSASGATENTWAQALAKDANRNYVILGGRFSTNSTSSFQIGYYTGATITTASAPTRVLGPYYVLKGDTLAVEGLYKVVPKNKNVVLIYTATGNVTVELDYYVTKG